MVLADQGLDWPATGGREGAASREVALAGEGGKEVRRSRSVVRDVNYSRSEDPELRKNTRPRHSRRTFGTRRPLSLQDRIEQKMASPIAIGIGIAGAGELPRVLEGFLEVRR